MESANCFAVLRGEAWSRKCPKSNNLHERDVTVLQSISLHSEDNNPVTQICFHFSSTVLGKKDIFLWYGNLLAIGKCVLVCHGREVCFPDLSMVLSKILQLCNCLSSNSTTQTAEC